MVPESEINVVTPVVFISGNESFLSTAAAIGFSFLPQAGKKRNITVAQTATVMLMID